jgi:hypothetical protein
MKLFLLVVKCISAGALLVIMFPAVQAEPVQWKVEDGGNGHFYEVIVVPGGISWPDANAAALRVNEHSHLTTIQSQAEDDFVHSLITTGSAWIGGIQIEGPSAPDEGWRWATGEPFTFINWGPGEPNDLDTEGEDEVVIEMVRTRGAWNDLSITSARSAFVVEWIKPSELVAIDIKPGNDRNPINPRSRGRLTVAILVTDEFDASTVDVSTVQFGRGAAEPVWYRLYDVGADGDWDLVLKFNTQDTGIVCGDTEATLTGETFDGLSFAGTDSIKTVGCKHKKHHNKHDDDDH